MPISRYDMCQIPHIGYDGTKMGIKIKTLEIILLVRMKWGLWFKVISLLIFHLLRKLQCWPCTWVNKLLEDSFDLIPRNLIEIG